jgi:transposase-like protein
MKKQRLAYDLDYKRRVVAAYLSGAISADDLAKREGLVRGQICKWRVQLENRDRHERIAEIADTEGVGIEQARRIRELEEELAATRQKLAQTMLENDLLKNFSRTHRSRAHRVGTSTPSGSWLG